MQLALRWINLRWINVKCLSFPGTMFCELRWITEHYSEHVEIRCRQKREEGASSSDDDDLEILSKDSFVQQPITPLHANATPISQSHFDERRQPQIEERRQDDAARPQVQNVNLAALAKDGITTSLLQSKRKQDKAAIKGKLERILNEFFCDMYQIGRAHV